MPTVTPLPVLRRAEPAIPAEVQLLPTPVPTSAPVPAEQPAAVFSQGSANLLVSFADGAGDYRAEVVSEQGRRLRVIFDERVPAQGERWLEWDGKDEGGADAPLGRYYVLLYKDQKFLKRLLLVGGGSGW
jgi:flagellar hook assembly protein FlgD